MSPPSSSAAAGTLPGATNSVNKITLGAAAVVIVDTIGAVAQLIDALRYQPTQPPSLYIDLEGINLSRKGSISIMQIHSPYDRSTYLVDIHTLGSKAFLTCGSQGDCLKNILECEQIPKVFFDVRNDSDALYKHFGVHLRGIQDLQLMELATRSFSRRLVNGLAICIRNDVSLSQAEKREWQRIKEAGRRLFAPEMGGRYDVFNERPMPDAIKNYCANDVEILPRLWEYYDQKLTDNWRGKMIRGSSDRVALSHSPYFNGQGRHMAEAPSGW